MFPCEALCGLLTATHPAPHPTPSRTLRVDERAAQSPTGGAVV